MGKKIRIGIIFGGKSAEHEVSLQSAKNVIDALDKKKYEPVLIGVDKSGEWLMADGAKLLSGAADAGLIKLTAGENNGVAIIPQSGGKLSSFKTGNPEKTIDVAFPILHGPFGEDGTVQGLLKLANIPFVGSGVLGSAIGMDKDVLKRLLRDAGIKISKFIVAKENEAPNYQDIVSALGLPFFVKPANLGSSVGINKVKSEIGFKRAIEDAFKYDRKIMIEEYIEGREIECSVLGNDDPIASVPGEIIPTHEFYSYEAKYLDENGAKMEIPAKLNEETAKRIQEIAIKTFKTLCCEGMGRVDFFLKKDGEIFVNEINTIPGFTSISMYPKLWEASGISYSELIDRLILLAFERFEKESKLKTSYETGPESV
ncbi:MAG TPA: D-alanine--D-alanine ligase [Candidatus Paceibacterota bacterium]|nr:D-alanine--D-alanine ligase [Candidatus Paceibacterota bacterium]